MSIESSSSPEVLQPPFEAIDANGDLELTVGSHTAAVCRELQCASPVQSEKAMLMGRFAESSAKKVKLPADAPEYLRYILLFAHLQLARLPAELSLSAIAEVAKLCDKYDCVAVLKNRIMLWLLPYATKVVGDDAESWIWIGWVLHKLAYFNNGCLHVLEHVAPHDMSKLGELPPGCKGSRLYRHSKLLALLAYSSKDLLLTRARINFDSILDVAYKCLVSVQVDGDGGCRASHRMGSATCGARRQASVMKLFTQLQIPLHCSLRPDALYSEISLIKARKVIRIICVKLRADVLGLDHRQPCYSEFDSLLRTVSPDRDGVGSGLGPLSGEMAVHFPSAS